MSLTYDRLHAAVIGEAVGIRSRLELEPLGGPDDKIFPPTYGTPDSAETRYAVEDRVGMGVDGATTVRSVVLDSVASQANRFELVLLDAIRAGQLVAPVTSVDFAERGLFGIDRISDYEAPHRIFDALLRDSFDGENLFRHGVTGRAITEATSRNAAAVFHHSPHTLVFGGWDSTGPKGGRGAKYERALTSEIVAHGVRRGVRTSSRIDPAGIEVKAGTIYETSDELGWTLDASQATQDKNKPKLYARSGDRPGRPSLINHGNVTPSIDSKAGGVTAEQIVGTTVLSFIQLRRLRFPSNVTGEPVPAERRTTAENAARTALAALGLAATVLAYEQGFDLRSRCVLVPRAALTFDLVGRAGAVETVELDGFAAVALVSEAAQHADECGLGWRDGEMLLRPSDRLVDLIRRSQDVAVAGLDET
ncbi:MAG: type I-U CRISPR-associated RAMP protein Csb1/Cas7u [Actinomycetota bacterium]|nr:type I-U CRISPR-associated RAMP protein Csb1/Cas7u [Actinomycetota bacterium]